MITGRPFATYSSKYSLTVRPLRRSTASKAGCGSSFFASSLADAPLCSSSVYFLRSSNTRESCWATSLHSLTSPPASAGCSGSESSLEATVRSSTALSKFAAGWYSIFSFASRSRASWPWFEVSSPCFSIASKRVCSKRSMACFMTVFTWCGILAPPKLARNSWSASAGVVLETSCCCAATRASTASLSCPCWKRVRAAAVSVCTSIDSFGFASCGGVAASSTAGCRKKDAATAAARTSAAKAAPLPQSQ
mmetsp:Transcript_54347/g.143089  ORF Transcript_54347/g.143089 Transcript_54347/m.143089 type:complete len:250 (-) Transcript_54347:41-790(-)